MQVIQVKCWSEQEFLLKFQSVSQSVSEKYVFFLFQLDFVQIISPQFGQLVKFFFRRQNSRVECQFRTKNTIFNYTI